jgi:hypothetical protein
MGKWFPVDFPLNQSIERWLEEFDDSIGDNSGITMGE